MKSPISELDYGKELFGQNLPNRRYNPNWKKLIPNDEPNTDDENKALTLLKKWYDEEIIVFVFTPTHCWVQYIRKFTL